MKKTLFLIFKYFDVVNRPLNNDVTCLFITFYTNVILKVIYMVKITNNEILTSFHYFINSMKMRK